MLGVESRKAGGSQPNARGPAPVCFGAGCLERPRFYKINFMLVTFNVLVVFSTGMSESVQLRPFGQLCPDGHFSLMLIRNMQRELLQDQLAARLMHGIRTGRWPVGSMLPRELELCESEGVSRFTVRAAMKKLESAGLIRRTPHVGTMVVSTGQAKSLNRGLSSMSDLDRLASNNPRRILDIREFVVSRELSPRIGFPPGETLIRFSMVRTGSKPGDPPIAWTTEYVNRSWQRLVHEAPRHPEQLMIDIISGVYRKKCVEIRQVVEAMLLSEKAALHLEGLSGSPVRRITRRYLDVKGHAILTTISTHPADRYAFNLNVQIDPEGGRTSFTADGL